METGLCLQRHLPCKRVDILFSKQWGENSDILNSNIVRYIYSGKVILYIKWTEGERLEAGRTVRKLL